jgi:MFS family permease
MASPSFRDVLREPDFFRLWLGQIISSIGDRFYQFALLGVVLGINQGSELGKESARVVFCGMLPGLLFAPWLGWVVDRFDRKAVMIFTDLVRVVLTLSLLYFWFVLQSLSVVFGIIFLMGAMNGLFIPARQAALPQLISGERLVTANALIALVGVIASLIGSLFAGLMVSIFGPKSSFLLNAAGFLVSAWFIYRIRRPLLPQENKGAGMVAHWEEILMGAREVISRAELKLLVLLSAIFAFVSGMFLITVLEHVVKGVDLSLARDLADGLVRILTPLAPKSPVIETKVLALGLLMAGLGVGLGLGVWTCGKSRILTRSCALPFLALVGLGGAMILFSTLTTYGPALAGCVFLGFWGATLAIPLEARLQCAVDNERRGRVFALKNLATTTSFLLALGVNLDGRLLTWRGAGALIQDIGIGVIAVAVLLALVNARSLKSFWSNPLTNDLR